MQSREQTEPTSTGSGQTTSSASHLPWHLIPQFVPGETDLADFTRRLEFLAGIWPPEHLNQLAPRAALQCQGSAFQKIVRLQPEKLKTNSMDGVKLIVSTLGGVWGKTTLEDKYEKFERAIYGTSQRSDETNESYMARHEILFEDMVSQGATLADMRAYILLRNSTLSSEDKKRVVIEADGNLTYDAVTKAIRMLGSKFFQEVQGQGKTIQKTRTYEVNMIAEQEEDIFMGEEISPQLAEGTDLTEMAVDHLLQEGDEDALIVHQFEDALIDTVQNDTEMAAFMSTYNRSSEAFAGKDEKQRFLASEGIWQEFWKVKRKAKVSVFSQEKTSRCQDCRIRVQGLWNDWSLESRVSQQEPQPVSRILLITR